VWPPKRPDVAIQIVQERLTRLSRHESGFVQDILAYVAALEIEANQRKLDQAELERHRARAWEALCDVVEICGGLVPEHAMRAPEYVRRLKAKLDEALVRKEVA